jgi:hypothetical protein
VLVAGHGGFIARVRARTGRFGTVRPHPAGDPVVTGLDN